MVAGALALALGSLLALALGSLLASALGSLLALALGSLLALALGSVLGLVHTLYSALYLHHAIDTAKVASAIGPLLGPLLCTRLCVWHSYRVGNSCCTWHLAPDMPLHWHCTGTGTGLHETGVYVTGHH